MASEWRLSESVILLFATGVLWVTAYSLQGIPGYLSALVGLLMFGLWALGATGRLGLSAFR